MSHAPTNTPPNDDLPGLIVRFLDGQLSDSEFTQLETLLASDESARILFVELAAQSHALRDAEASTPTERLASGGSASRSSDLRNPTRHASLQRGMVYACAAALLAAAAALAIYVFVFNSKPETRNPKPDAAPIATVTDTTGDLLGGGNIIAPGDTIPAGDVSLDRGSADFRLDNGVAVRLTGPTQLTIHDPMSATLTRGSATFDCPPNAKGYTVHLPGGSRIVDLGTAFGVRVLANDATVLQVTEGRVEAHIPGSSAVTIAAGESVMIARTLGVMPMRRVNLDFNGPTSGTGSGAAVWGTVADRWNALTVSPTPDSSLTESSYRVDGLADADGRATSVGFEMRNPDRRWRFYRAPDHAADAIRTDTVFVAASDNAAADAIEWRITGLMPGVEYELAMLSQRENGRNMHPTDFAIADGEPAVFDASYHAVFDFDGPNGSVRADAAGEIRGVMRRRPDQKFAAWSGWQLHGPMPDAVSPPPHAPTPENPQLHE